MPSQVRASSYWFSGENSVVFWSLGAILISATDDSDIVSLQKFRRGIIHGIAEMNSKQNILCTGSKARMWILNKHRSSLNSNLGSGLHDAVSRLESFETYCGGECQLM